jgi:hypothetical protein
MPDQALWEQQAVTSANALKRSAKEIREWAVDLPELVECLLGSLRLYTSALGSTQLALEDARAQLKVAKRRHDPEDLHAQIAQLKLELASYIEREKQMKQLLKGTRK